MVYKIYKTEGIILASRNLGEADKIFLIYTKDFGQLEILAQGARYLKSKLRFSLSTFSWLRLGFLRNKEFLRLVDAEELENFARVCFLPEKLEAASNISRFMARMIKGEEADFFLWQELKIFFEFLKNDLSEKELKALEILLKLRLLHHLGYLALKKEFLSLLKEEGLKKSTLKEADRFKPSIVKAIENSLKESQL